MTQGCPYIDAAKTTDPDNRSDIQRAHEQCLQAILPQAVSPAAAGCTPNPAGVGVGVMILGGPSAAAASAVASGAGGGASARIVPSPQALAVGGGGAWRDPQGRFSIAASQGWTGRELPQTRFGMGAVPRLYAACAEVAMNRQVPATRQSRQCRDDRGQPINQARLHPYRTGHVGRDFQARGFQTTVPRGTILYVISGSAAAEESQQFSSTFDLVVASFQFSEGAAVLFQSAD